MPLGTEVGLSPDDTVLDGDPAPPPTKRGTAAPHKSNSMSANECILFICYVEFPAEKQIECCITQQHQTEQIMT